MKVLIFPKNYSITIRDSKDELVGGVTITEKSPKTLLYSKKNSPTVFESVNFSHNEKTMSIKVKGRVFDYNEEIILGSDEEFSQFIFVDTKDIEPMTALKNR